MKLSYSTGNTTLWCWARPSSLRLLLKDMTVVHQLTWKLKINVLLYVSCVLSHSRTGRTARQIWTTGRGHKMRLSEQGCAFWVSERCSYKLWVHTRTTEILGTWVGLSSPKENNSKLITWKLLILSWRNIYRRYLPWIDLLGRPDERSMDANRWKNLSSVFIFMRK